MTIRISPFVCLLLPSLAIAEGFRSDVAPLIEASCVDCHDASTDTTLDLTAVKHDLTNEKTFRTWERIHDRVRRGEMPPETESAPAPKLVKRALESLQRDLHAASLAAQQEQGRVPARRLTKLEYGYTLHDLLAIDGDVTSLLPDEVASGTFDTVGSHQRLSSVHLESYLNAADAALDQAIRLGRNPRRTHLFDFMTSPFLDEFEQRPLSDGGSITLRRDDGFALFVDVDYLFRADAHGFPIITSGVYHIQTKVSAHQSDEPITFKLILREPGGGAKLLKAYDLQPGQPETIDVSAYFQPGDTFYPTFEMPRPRDETYGALFAVGGAKHYRGAGIIIHSQQVEGPIHESWPPSSTQRLFEGVTLAVSESGKPGSFTVELSKEPIEHVRETVVALAPRIVRRPSQEDEIDSFVRLAELAIAEGRSFADALRVPLRSMLSSPQFLLMTGDPGPLDDHALASRLSYFLWKSLPDEELVTLAESGTLSDPVVLAGQVERLLADGKSRRFVEDFLGQWLRLDKVNATTPDETLYPEYDELLAAAILKEPTLFFEELLRESLSLTNLIDSEFAFVNRRLAKHYDLPDVAGQEFQRVDLPADSPRGGVLTQAAILKTTANGTVTSPVTRGNFVLTNFLGTPPAPPPPSAGSIEPDTRGKTTIREILAAHRDIETCNRCHREIDPPGFALESFDPIGGFREKYRATGGGFLGFLSQKPYHDGPPVDASGVTSDGQSFSAIDEFKQLLLDDRDQVARHFVSQLVVYSTGGEIHFADREQIEHILDRTRDDGFPVRELIHEVVQSRMFKSR